jgi:UDP-N-acetylmuramoylalanine--D-glutamate ligase
VSFLKSLCNQKVIVLGAGLTGESTISFLRQSGAEVTVIDEVSGEAEIVTDLESVDLAKIDFSVISPGWRPDHPFVRALENADIPILSEVDLAWRIKSEINPDQRWLAVTGTNGKTTTVQMAEAMLLAQGRHAFACGNVGTTVIEAVTSAKHEILVLELSSFQLHWSREVRLHASVILNISEDHIDWHQTFDNYADAKLKIIKLSDLTLLNSDDPEVVSRSKNLSGRKVFYSLSTPANHELGLVENIIVDRQFVDRDAVALFELTDVTPAVPHNVSNAMAAAGLVRTVGVDPEAISSALQSFTLDSHRLQLIAEHAGVSWIDDSKATNPHAARASLFSQSQSIWIAGGLTKGANVNDLIESAKSRIRAAILIGRDASVFAEAFANSAPEIPIYYPDANLKGRELMQDVVKIASEISIPGDSVLLAPASASMDQFKNYAERGDLFAAAVRELCNDE